MAIASIIGGGVIGGGWASRFLLNGWDVQVFDPDPDAERKISEVLTNARRSLPGLYDQSLPSEGKISFHTTIKDAVADAIWIQESVPERLDLKHRVYEDIAKHTNTAIASSTSGFKPSELGKNVFVAHPFNPVYLLPLVELVAPPAAAGDILESIGMVPLHVRKEIDAHIADRFLEAVWREALWLIKDGIATTEEIDNSIRYGFGLRWGQMGLFETYRIAGGEAGMRHFIEQFGPALQWPWTKLMDVPELTDTLIDEIAAQSDAQSGAHSIRELERMRDDNLVAMMRALKVTDAAAGKIIKSHEATFPAQNHDFGKPIQTVKRSIPINWTDYNGHMNESRYGQVFSDAADAVMVLIGADSDYVASGLSYFTVETRVAYLDETHAHDQITVDTVITQGSGKKLFLWHEMRHIDGRLIAECEQRLLHVSLDTRKTCDPAPEVAAKLAEIATLHKSLKTSVPS